MAGPGGKIVAVTADGNVAAPRPDWVLKPWMIMFPFALKQHQDRQQEILAKIELHLKDKNIFYEHTVSGLETARVGAYEALYDAQAECELMFAQEACAGLLKAGQGYEVDYKRIKQLKVLHPSLFSDKKPPATTPTQPAQSQAGSFRLPPLIGPNHDRNVTKKADKKLRKAAARAAARAQQPAQPPVQSPTAPAAKKS
jgi:hypothetical protein